MRSTRSRETRGVFTEPTPEMRGWKSLQLPGTRRSSQSVCLNTKSLPFCEINLIPSSFSFSLVDRVTFFQQALKDKEASSLELPDVQDLISTSVSQSQG
jgi:hypothetical protein